ncbi:MAG: hypothetical protein ACYTGG_05665 [Planctomycetota bacterium]|jgi:hypothetical protein
MQRNSMSFIVTTSASAILVAAMIHAAPASDDLATSKADGAGGPVEIADASTDVTVALRDHDWNRRIDDIGFAPSSTGLTDVIVHYSMEIAEGGATADMTAEILVEVLEEGTVVASAMLPGQFDFLSNDAVLCAVQCYSNCGSIFGDGICGGCDCSYNRSATFPLAVPAGATVRASLLVLITPEIHTDDDQFEVVFGTPIVPCEEDFDGNGAVDISDLLRLLANWGDCS